MLSDARVIRIETETDIERLRQVALLQRAELDRLYTRLAQLTEELAHARGEDAIAALQLELTAIQEQLAARTRALFSPSSEKRPRPGDRTRDAAPAPRTGHGPRRPARVAPGRGRPHARRARPDLPEVRRRAPRDDGPVRGVGGDRRRRALLPPRAPQ